MTGTWQTEVAFPFDSELRLSERSDFLIYI